MGVNIMDLRQSFHVVLEKRFKISTAKMCIVVINAASCFWEIFAMISAADDFAPHRDRRTLESARLCSSAAFCCTSNHALNSSESPGARDHSGGNGPCGIPLDADVAVAVTLEVAVTGTLLAL